MTTRTTGDELLHRVRELRDAEKQQTGTLKEMANAATDAELASNLSEHADETKVHVKRLDQACRALGVSSRGGDSSTMRALLSDADNKPAPTGSQNCDSALIATEKRVEEYETKGYEEILAAGKELGIEEAVEVLRGSLGEEKLSEWKLSEIETRLDDQK
jgi:ferritin-like metal-binding protein YciE